MNYVFIRSDLFNLRQQGPYSNTAGRLTKIYIFLKILAPVFCEKIQRLHEKYCLARLGGRVAAVPLPPLLWTIIQRQLY